MNSDFRDLLQLLGARKVRYLVVGGYAVIFHAEPRFTQDLDIWVEPGVANAAALMQVFAKFGLPLMGGIEPEDFTVAGTQYMIGVAPCAIDFLTSVPGLHFPACWNRRKVAEDSGIEINYLSKPDLVVAKKTAGRQRDLMDLEILGEAP